MRAPVTDVRVAAYTVPTDAPESDGTFAWTATTLVAAELSSGATTGLGYTYADGATARLAARLAEEVVRGTDAFAIPA